MGIEELQQLQQIEQLAIGLQIALKQSNSKVKTALLLNGFSKDRNFISLKFLYLLVGCCRKARGLK